MLEFCKKKNSNHNNLPFKTLIFARKFLSWKLFTNEGGGVGFQGSHPSSKRKNPQNSISSVVAWRIWALWRQCFSLKGFSNFHLNFKCWLGPLQCSIYFASGSYSCLFNPKAWKVTRDIETFLPIKYLFQRIHNLWISLLHFG